MKIYDSIIIGAGPAGIGAALYLSRAKIDFLWLEKSFPGGKLPNLHEIGNYPGFAPINGFDLAESLLRPLGFGPQIAAVTSLKRTADGLFEVKCGETPYLSKTVLLATGLSNSPKVKGEREYLGRGVSYCATCDGPLYREKEIVLWGEGDRAYEEALYLAGLASKLHLVFPGASFYPLLDDSLKAYSNIVFHPHSSLKEIQGDADKKAVSVALIDTADELISLPTSAIFPLLGEGTDTFFLRYLNPQTEKGFIVVDDSMETTEPGLFAAGDIVKKRLRQVVTALSDGAVASNGIIRRVREASKDA